MTSSERLEYILRVRHAANVSELEALATTIRRAHGASPESALFTAAIEEKVARLRHLPRRWEPPRVQRA